MQRPLPVALPVRDGDDEERLRLALLRFERFAAERHAQIEWLWSSRDHSIERFVRVARLADLLALGHTTRPMPTARPLCRPGWCRASSAKAARRRC